MVGGTWSLRMSVTVSLDDIYRVKNEVPTLPSTRPSFPSLSIQCSSSTG